MNPVPSTGAPPDRFAFIHTLRGVAALLVVWAHLSGFWLFEHGKSSLLQDVWYRFVVVPFHIFQDGGHLGVVLFFLISGFVITHASLRETRRAFAAKRLMRILPPLIFAVAVAWVSLQIAASTGDRILGVNSGGPWRWLGALLLLDGFVPGKRILDVTWTLVIEMMFYALAFVLLDATRVRALRSTWVMSVLWIGLTLIAFNVPGLAGQNRALITYVGFLVLGRTIYLWRMRLIAPCDAAVLAVTVSVIYGLFIEAWSPGFLLTPGGWVGVEPLVSYVLALVIFLVMMWMNPARTVQPFKSLGDISYSLYLLHLPVGVSVLNVLDRLGAPESLNTVAAILAAIAVAWVAYRLVEVPSQRWRRLLMASRV